MAILVTCGVQKWKRGHKADTFYFKHDRRKDD